MKGRFHGGVTICRARLSSQRELDWVGNHMVSTEVGGPDSEGGVPYITVQLTDPATGATRLFVRGAHCACQSHLMSILKNQVSCNSTGFDGGYLF